MRNRKPENYYELIGEDFDRFMSDYDVERRISLMRRLWPTDATGPMLEVGCGTGAVTRGVIDLTDHLTVTDLSALLARRVGSALGVQHAAADATALPFPDCSFAMVYSSECIEHTPDPTGAVREMLRVCTPGGYVLITTPNKLWYPVVRGAQLLKMRKFQGNETFLSPDELIQAVKPHGSVLSIDGCHVLPWQLPTAKRWLPRFDRHGRNLYRLMINIAVCVRKNR